MDRRLNIGRIPIPHYVEGIRDRFEKTYPDSTPSDFQVYYTVNYFWDYVEDCLANEEPLTIYGFCKFFTTNKEVTTAFKGKPIPEKDRYVQYYPKMTWSQALVIRIREKKGTLTTANKNSILMRKKFIEEMWRKRKHMMLTKQNRKISPALDALNQEFPDTEPTIAKLLKESGAANYKEYLAMGHAPVEQISKDLSEE